MSVILCNSFNDNLHIKSSLSNEALSLEKNVFLYYCVVVAAVVVDVNLFSFFFSIISHFLNSTKFVCHLLPYHFSFSVMSEQYFKWRTIRPVLYKCRLYL